MYDENTELPVRVKFWFNVYISASGQSCGKQKMKEYLIDRVVAEDMIDDVSEGKRPYLTFHAKRFFNGNWIDCLETIILANVGWIEWPTDLDSDYEEYDEGSGTWS